MPKDKTEDAPKKKAKPKAVPKDRNWKVTPDALKVIEHFKNKKPGNDKRVSEFVSTAIIAYGRQLYGNKIAKPTSPDKDVFEERIVYVEEQITELRKTILPLKHGKKKISEAIDLLEEHKIKSYKDLIIKFKKVEDRPTINSIFPEGQDWKDLITMWKNDEIKRNP